MRLFHSRHFRSVEMAAKRKGKQQQEENVQLGPTVADGENVFGVAHIFASFNDTFVHVTDLSGRLVTFWRIYPSWVNIAKRVG